jgi:hypothetical protein
MPIYDEQGSGGAYGDGEAVATEVYGADVLAGGVYAGAEAAIFIPEPRPIITFQVALFDLTSLLSFPQPDAISQVVLMAQQRTINIPGVEHSLKHGDQFSLFGELALRVKNTYKDVLTVIQQE